MQFREHPKQLPAWEPEWLKNSKTSGEEQELEAGSAEGWLWHSHGAAVALP